MRCKNELYCSGDVDLGVPILLRVGCSDFNEAFACSVCGRLHWENGEPVLSRRGFRAFLEGSDIVVQKDDKGAEHHRLMAGM
jgi:hypothetical protein